MFRAQCSHWNERKRRLHLVAGDSLHFEVRVAGKRDKMLVLVNFGRTVKMWAICWGKINILPTSCQ